MHAIRRGMSSLDTAALTQLAESVVQRALTGGATVAEAQARAGWELSVRVRLGETELVQEAGTKRVSLRVLRDERFKLYVDTQRRPVQLFDLASDPWEKRNLIASEDPEAVAALARLSEPLATFPERDNDPIYTPLAPQPWDVPVTAESEVWKK